MRFSILALAASPSAAAVTPCADYGSWDFTGSVSFPVRGTISIAIDVTYRNAELATPIDVNCT